MANDPLKGVGVLLPVRPRSMTSPPPVQSLSSRRQRGYRRLRGARNAFLMDTSLLQRAINILNQDLSAGVMQNSKILRRGDGFWGKKFKLNIYGKKIKRGKEKGRKLLINFFCLPVREVFWLDRSD